MVYRVGEKDGAFSIVGLSATPEKDTTARLTSQILSTFPAYRINPSVGNLYHPSTTPGWVYGTLALTEVVVGVAYARNKKR